MSPQRIQLRRTKGWRKPDGAIVVARPSVWGNPFVVGHQAQVDSDGESANVTITPDLAVLCYRDHIEFMLDRAGCGNHPVDVAIYDKRVAAFAELRGHDLACWCPLDQPCHADVLLELANA